MTRTKPEDFRPEIDGEPYGGTFLLKRDHVAKILRVHPNHVYDLSIPKVRISKGRVRWAAGDVEAFIAERRGVA